MSKQLNVNLAFTADTGKAAASIQALQNQLTQLMNSAAKDSASLGLTKDIKDATTAAAQLKAQLSGAMTSSGTLDLTKFNDSLKASGMSLEQYRSKLSALGPEGTAAFSQLASSVASAEIPLKRTNTLLTELGTSLANTVRWQLSSSLLHGFIGGLQHAFGYAQDLNESLNNIRIVTGQSTDQMAELAQKANQAAKELSTRTTDYTNAALIYYQQGLDDKAVEERTRTTLKLANVTRQSAEEVSSQMTAIWNNFSDGTKELEYYADAITALGAKTASSSSEIAQGLSKFAAVADTIGLSYETASAAIATVVAETRQSADTVGNAFKSIFARLESLKLGETLEDGVGLTKYTQALETVGVQVLDMNGELRDADSILSDLGDKWSQISDTQKVALANTVAGQRQYAQFVALFDNWDKVQENMKVAADSKGTLQEQQEIYAEGWEAASKRVQASAEAIYSALISDKFFIGFNNLLSGILNRVNDLIKGFGGLGGTLTTIGALLTKVFSNQIASNVDRVINNLTGASVKGAQQQQREAIDALTKEAQIAQARGSAQGEAQAASLKAQATLQDTLLRNQQRYNEEQLKTAQNLLDSNQHLREQVQLQGELVDKEQKAAEFSKQNEMSRAKRYANLNGISITKQDETNLKSSIAEFEKLQMIIPDLQAKFDSFRTVFSDNLTDTQKVQQFGEIWKNSFDKIKTTMEESGAFTDKYIQKFKQIGDEVAAGTRPIEHFQTTMDKAISILVSKSDKSEIGLAEQFKEFYGNADLAAEAVERLKEKLSAMGIDTAKLKTELEALKNSTKGAEDAMNGWKTVASSIGTTISGLSNFAMSLASTINSVKSAIDIWNNEDLTWGEKALQTIPSLLMSLSMLTNSIIGTGSAAVITVAQHLPVIGTFMAEASSAKAAAGGVGSLGIAFKAAFPELLLFTAAAAAVIGIIYGISTALKDANKNSVENLLKEAQEESQKAKDSLEEAKTAAENLQTAFDNYQSVREQLDNCTEGTDEWKEALEKVNEEVLSIIENYPELAKYLSTDENGALTLNEEGFKDLLNQTNNNKYARYGEYFQASANELYAEQRVAEKNVTDAALKAGVQNIFGANDNYLDESQINSVFSSMADRFIELLDSGIEGASFDPGQYIDLMLKDIANQYKESIMTNRGIGSAEFDELLASQHVQMRDDGKLNIPKELNQMILDSGQVDQSWINNQVQTLKGLLEDAFEDEELVQALYDYKDAIKTTTETQEKYALAMGEMILKENEEFMKQDNASDFFRAGGDLYNILLKKYQQEMEKQSDEDLLDYYSKHTGIKELEGKTSFDDTDKNGKEAIKYEDSSGEQIITREDVINYQAASQAAYDLAGEMTSLTQKTNELAESESKSDNALGDILKRQAISNNGKDLREAIDNAQLKDNGEYKGTFSGAEKQIAIYLDKMLGDGLDGILSESTLNKYGFKTMSDIVNAVIEGMQEVDNRIEQARNLGDKTLNQIMEKMINKNLNFEDLDIDEQEQAKQLLLDSIHSLGAQGFDAMIDLFTKSGEHIGQVIETLSNEDINWATVGTEELAEKISELGIDSEISTESLDSILKVLKDLGEINLESATQQYKDLHDIVKDVSEDSFIDAEQLKTLKDFNIDVDKFFTPMADGTYKLIGDAQEFYDTVNKASIEGFKQGIEQELDKKETLEGLKSSYESEDNKAKDNLLESARMEKGFNKEQVKNQLEYLNALNLTGEVQEKLTAIEEDYTHNKGDTIRMTSTHLDQLQELIDLYKGEWEKMLEEGFDETEIDNYTKAMISSLTNLEDVRTVLEDITDLKGNPLFTDDQIQAYEQFFKDYLFNPDNIKTFEDFKEGLKVSEKDMDIGPLLDTPEKISKAWKSLDLSKLTKEEFDEVKDSLNSSDLVEGIQALFNNGEITKNKALEELINQIKDGKIEAKDAREFYDELTKIDNETTAQTIERINQKIKDGLANASDYDELLNQITSNKRTTADEKTSDIKKEMSKVANDRNNLNVDQRAEELDKYVSAGYSQIKDAGGSLNEQIAKVDQLRDHYTNLFTNIPDLAKLGPQAMESALSELDNSVMTLIADAENVPLNEKLELAAEYMTNLGYSADEVEPKLVSVIANDSGTSTQDKLIAIIDTVMAGSKNLQQYKDEIVDIIANDSTMTTGEKLHELTEYLTLDDAKMFKEEILGILDADSNMGTAEKISYLNSLMQQGIITAEEYGSKLLEYMNQDSDLNVLDKKLGLETNEDNFKRDKPQQEDFEGKYGSQEADKAAFNEAMAQFNADPEGIQAYLNAYQQLIDTVQGSDFSSMDQWDDFFDRLPEGVDYLDQMNQTLVDYASQFSNLSDEVSRYNQLTALGEDTTRALMDIEIGARANDMAEAYDQDAEAIQNVAKAMQEAADVEGEGYESLKDNAEAAVDAATRYVRLNSAIKDLQKNYEKYANELRTIQKTENSVDKAMAASSDTAQQMSKTIADLIGTSEQFVDVKMLDAIDPNDFEAAAQGDEAALARIRQGFADSMDEAYNLGSAANDVLDEISNLSEGDPIDLDTSPAIQSLFDMLVQAGLSADEIESIFAGLGIDCDVTPITEAMQEAADASAEAGNSIVSNMAFDAKANVKPVDQSATKEDVGFDEQIIWTENPQTHDVLEEGATSTTQVTSNVWAAHKIVHPVTASATESSESKLVGMEMSNANVSAGGKVSENTTGGGGGGGGRGRGGGGSCFVAGTLVSTNQGFKNIEDIKIDDIVLSYNLETEQNEYSKVLQTMVHVVYENIYTLYIENEQLMVTGIHRFLITRNGIRNWIHAKDLQIGDLVQYADGSLHIIKQIDIKVDLKVVYNFEVSGNHNYYVGYNKILVHNKKSGGGGRGRTERKTFNRAPQSSKGKRTPVEKIDDKATKNTEALEDATEALNKELEKNNRLKSRAYGEDKIALLEKEKQIIDKLIAEQKKYQATLQESINQLKKLINIDNSSKAKAYNDQVMKIREIEERIKTKQGEGKNTKKDYKELEAEQEKLRGMDKSDLYEGSMEDSDYSIMVTYSPEVNFGIAPKINDKGEITNADEIEAKISAMEEKKNADWQKRTTQAGRKGKKQQAKILRDIKREKAEWEAEVDAWREWKAIYEGKVEDQQAAGEKIEGYIEDKEDADYDIQDIRDSLNKNEDEGDTQTELEKIQYSIELKLNIKEDQLNLLEFLFDKLGDKAEKATTRIGLLGKELETAAKKQKIYEEGIARILDIHGGAGSSTSNIMSKMQSQYQNTMFGRADFGNLSAEKLQNMQQRWGRSSYQPNQQQTQSQHWSGIEAVEAMKQGNQEVVEALKNKKQWYKEEAEQMQEYARSLLDTAENMRTLKDKAIQMIGEVFDELQDRMDDALDNHSQLQNKLQHYYNMMELVGRSIYGGTKEVMDQMAKDQLILAENNLKMTKKQMETTQAMIAETEAKRQNAEKQKQKELAAGNQAAADEWQHNIDLMDEDLKDMREKDKELVQAYWEAEEAAAEAATTKYENMVKNSIQEFTDSVAKGFQSFEALQTAFDRQRNTNKTYVEDYEKVYKLSKMAREIEQQIAKIDNLKSKEAYLKLQNEINKASEKGVRLSQYDLDLMQKKFDVLKAQAEFEESQSNKTQVSLTRDNEGNYGYVYTANEEDVQKAEQTYSDKIYEMRKLNANYINDLQSQLLQLNTNMINDIQKLKDTLGEDNDTYQSELQRIKENYAQQQEALTQQLTKALNDSNEINTSYLQEYASLTGDRLALEADYVSTWQDTVLGQLLDGYSTLADYQRAWTENTKDLFDDVAQASRDWRDDNRDVLEIAGDDFKEYVDSMGNEQDIMVENSSQMVDAFELQTDMIRDLFSGTIDAAENLMGAWTSIVGQMLSDAAQLEAAFLDVMEAWGDLVSQSNASSSSDDSSSSSSTSTASTNEKKPEETKKDQGIDDQAANRSERIVWLDESDRVDNKKKKNKKKTKTETKKKIKTENKTKTKTNKNTGKKKKKKGAATYATGGYTGEWGASGKLAVLHEKELVLNEEDTENLLDSVEIVRDISKVIDINAMVAQNGSGFGIGSYFNSRGNTATIQQQITINADFPNVTSRDEIKSAFDNMVGLASQYANRRFFK